MPKLDVYGWQGVNTTKNPIQLEDNELSKAQNAFRDMAGEHGALRKRPGLTKINASAMTGEILGFINVPLNPITLRTFLIGADQTATAPAYTWFTSVNEFGAVGTSTVPAAVPKRAITSGTWFGTVGNTMLNKGTQNGNLFFYPGDHLSGELWPIRVYDGTIDKELFVVPPNPSAVIALGESYYPTTPPASPTYTAQICQMLVVGSRLYIVIVDYPTIAVSGMYSRIIEYNMETRVVRQIGQGAGPATGDIGDGAVGFRSICYFQGYLYAGVGSETTGFNSNDAGIWKIQPDVETTWVQELSLTSGTVGEVPMAIAEFRGQLYAGLQDYDTASQRLLVRSTTGSWSASNTVGTATGSAWLCLKVFENNLYATSFDNAATPVTRIHKFDGSSWTIVKTIETAANARMGVDMVVHNDRLYVLCANSSEDGLVTHTDDGSSWTDLSTGLEDDVTSVFGVLAT